MIGEIMQISQELIYLNFIILMQKEKRIHNFIINHRSKIMKMKKIKVVLESKMDQKEQTFGNNKILSNNKKNIQIEDFKKSKINEEK